MQLLVYLQKRNHPLRVKRKHHPAQKGSVRQKKHHPAQKGSARQKKHHPVQKGKARQQNVLLRKQQPRRKQKARQRNLREKSHQGEILPDVDKYDNLPPHYIFNYFATTFFCIIIFFRKKPMFCVFHTKKPS